MHGKRSSKVIDSKNSTARKRVCIENEVHRSCLEDLSNEIVYEILDFLDGCDANEAFSNLNTRFNRIVNCPSRLLKINLSFTSKSIFEYRCKKIISENIEHIVSLHLSGEATINRFLKLFSINAFIRLESLILDQIESNKLEPVLIHLSSLPSLFSLSIHVNSHFQDEKNVYHRILRLSKIRYCNLKFPNGGEGTPLSIAINEEQQNKSIEHFIINGPCHIHQFIAFLSCMSRLRVVRCNSLLGFYNMQLKTSIALLNLQHLYLELNNLPFNQFNSLMTNISSTLQSLGICTTNDDHYINADNWITLISSYVCTLQNFYLYYSNSTSSDEDYDAFHRTIRSFDTNFWTDRKWFFGHQHYSNQVEDGMDTETLVIFYSVKPYRNHNYDLFERASNLECHGDTGRNLSRCLTIHGHRSIISCEVKFQNVTSLIISDEHMDKDHWSIVNLIRIVPLEQLTKLIVECDSVCINTLLKILNDAKRIRSLELGRYEISDTEFPLIKHDNDNMIINRNNIVQLTIRSVCTLQQLQLLVNMFPHIKCLELIIAHADYESIIKFLLVGNPNHKQHLFSLYVNILDSQDEILKNLLTLIDKEKSLIDYTINYLHNKMHIWW